MSKTSITFALTIGGLIGASAFYGLQKYYTNEPVGVIVAEPVEPPERAQFRELAGILNGEKEKNQKLSGDFASVRDEVVRLNSEIAKLVGASLLGAPKTVPSAFSTHNVICHAGAPNPIPNSEYKWGDWYSNQYHYKIKFSPGSCEFSQVDVACSRRIDPLARRADQGFVIATDAAARCDFDVDHDSKFQRPPDSLVDNVKRPALDANVASNPFPVEVAPTDFNTHNVACHQGAPNPTPDSEYKWGDWYSNQYHYKIKFSPGSCEFSQVNVACSRRVDPLARRADQGFVIATDAATRCDFDGDHDSKFQRPPDSLTRDKPATLHMPN
jgi:hypothetical protein